MCGTVCACLSVGYASILPARSHALAAVRGPRHPPGTPTHPGGHDHSGGSMAESPPPDCPTPPRLSTETPPSAPPYSAGRAQSPRMLPLEASAPAPCDGLARWISARSSRLTGVSYRRRGSELGASRRDASLMPSARAFSSGRGEGGLPCRPPIPSSSVPRGRAW